MSKCDNELLALQAMSKDFAREAAALHACQLARLGALAKQAGVAINPDNTEYTTDMSKLVEGVKRAIQFVGAYLARDTVTVACYCDDVIVLHGTRIIAINPTS